MQHDQELATYEHVSAGTYRLIGAPSAPSVLNTGSFKKSKLTDEEINILGKSIGIGCKQDHSFKLTTDVQLL